MSRRRARNRAAGSLDRRPSHPCDGAELMGPKLAPLPTKGYDFAEQQFCEIRLRAPHPPVSA